MLLELSHASFVGQCRQPVGANAEKEISLSRREVPGTRGMGMEWQAGVGKHRLARRDLMGGAMGACQCTHFRRLASILEEQVQIPGHRNPVHAVTFSDRVVACPMAPKSAKSLRQD